MFPEEFVHATYREPPVTRPGGVTAADDWTDYLAQYGRQADSTSGGAAHQ